VPHRADNHGLSRLTTVSRNRCSLALSCACHVVPKLTINRGCLRRASAPGWSPGWARRWWVTRVARYPVTSVPRCRRPEVGLQIVHRKRCSIWTPVPGPLQGKLANVTGHPLGSRSSCVRLRNCGSFWLNSSRSRKASDLRYSRLRLRGIRLGSQVDTHSVTDMPSPGGQVSRMTRRGSAGRSEFVAPRGIPTTFQRDYHAASRGQSLRGADTLAGRLPPRRGVIGLLPTGYHEGPNS
jgi:hypothetical protein